MIRSRAGRNRSFCRSSRGFDIASPEQSPLDQGITTRLKSESQIARNPSPIPPFLQNRLLAQARLSLCPSDIQILHGRLCICHLTVRTSTQSKTPSPNSRLMCERSQQEPWMPSKQPPPTHSSNSNPTNALTSSLT